MRDFRQFYGENTLAFATDAQKNVTLIHGENGVGKTTILNAIMWCLFETLTPDFERPKELLNHEAKKKGKTVCHVELWFEHENEEYLAHREFIDTKDSEFKVFRIKSGNHTEIPGPKAFINSVLPQDMAPYFFFHGEGVVNLGEGHKGSDFRKAVRNILGFTFAESAIDDLRKIKRDYSKQLKKVTDKDSILNKEARRKAEQEELLEKLKRELRQCRNKQAELRAEQGQIEHKLDELGNPDVSSIRKQIQRRQGQKQALSTQLAKLDDQRQMLVQKFGWAIFGRELAMQGLDFIDQSTITGRIPSPYQESFVQDLLSKEECICGAELAPGSIAREKVAQLLATANTAAINNRLMKARSVARILQTRVDEFRDEVRDLEIDREKIQELLGIEERELADLEQTLKEIDEREVQKWVAARTKVREEYDRLVKEQGYLEAQVETCKKTIAEATQQIERYGSQKQAVTRITNIQSDIDEMIRRCERRLAEFEGSARQTIQSQINEFLAKFSRKSYRVRIEENFNFFLTRVDRKPVAKSRGERLLLNLAFIAALIQHAELRSTASGEFLVKGTTAPFVIDAPFGELDDTYREATASVLPESVRQIVFLLSSSHWQGTVEHVLRQKIGKEYVLVSHSTADQGSKPDDKIVIEGKEYQQSKYNQEVDRTVIQEIRH